MMMPDSRVVSALSLVATLVSGLSLGACARGPSPATWDAAVEVPDQSATVRFDNGAEVPVDVYLVAEQRQWRLGRVAPGARTMLRIPDGALRPTSFVRLVVLAGEPLSIDAAHAPGATFSVAQPASELLVQRFMFWNQTPGSPQLLGMRARGGRR